MSDGLTDLAWPPPLKIIRHPRAKSVRLRIESRDEVIMTVPKKFSERNIFLLLEENKIWITKKLLSVKIKKVDTLPEKIFLAMCDETWSVVTMPCQKKLRLVTRPVREVVLMGETSEIKKGRKLLIAWVRTQAEIKLAQLLREVSEEIKLPYDSLIVRDQRTRWGSCSSGKMISLNYKLLFLPRALARYVMVHELCHTVHMNHSEKFWNLVAMFDGEWKLHRKELHRAEKDGLPDWV